MKNYRLLPLLLITAFLLSITSCFVSTQGNNEKHKGWYKNPNNPHHPASTNPGHTKSKNKHK